MSLAEQIAASNGLVVRNARLPNVTHIFPPLEETDHAFDGLGCHCEPNKVYQVGGTILIHRKTRAE